MDLRARRLKLTTSWALIIPVLLLCGAVAIIGGLRNDPILEALGKTGCLLAFIPLVWYLAHGYRTRTVINQPRIDCLTTYRFGPDGAWHIVAIGSRRYLVASGAHPPQLVREIAPEELRMFGDVLTEMSHAGMPASSPDREGN